MVVAVAEGLLEASRLRFLVLLLDASVPSSRLFGRRLSSVWNCMRRVKDLGVSSTGACSLALFLLLAGFESSFLSAEGALAFLGAFWKAGSALTTEVGGRSNLWLENWDQYAEIA
jgi:hypothetical protein